MKNNPFSRTCDCYVLTQITRIMKLSIFFFVLGIMQVFAATSYSQSTKLAIDLSNTRLEKVLDEIENQSEFYFLYNEKLINLDRRVNISMKNEKVAKVLDFLFHKTDVDYQIVDRKIILAPSSLNNLSEVKDGTITGKVSDKSGIGMPGVNVVVKGTTNGTTTDIDGNFRLENANKGATLVFSFIGYISQEVVITGKDPINVTLKENTMDLDEVVVVGYGTQKKINLTGAVAQITAKEMKSRPLTNVTQGLSGLVPGLTVVQGSGQPGDDAGSIRIRGIGSFSGARSTPMTIVDGIESSLDQVLPGDIESISILKDAASAAIYGSKAANGVIIITTKKGKKGTTKVQYNANFGWQTPTDLVEKMSSADYAVGYNEALEYSGKNPRWSSEDIQKFRDGSSPFTHPNTDWKDLFYVGSGFQQQHNVSISGGNDKVTFMNSIGYQDQQGIIENSSNEKYSLRSNLHAIVSPRLTTSLNLSYTRSLKVEPTNPYTSDQEQIFRQVNRISPWVPYKNEDGSYGTISDGNPIAWMDLDATDDINRDYLTALADMEYKLIDDLFIKAVVSYKMNNKDDHEFVKDIQYNSTKYHGPNKMWQRNSLSSQVNGDIVANYNKTIGEQHNISAMGGYHSELYKFKYNETFRKNFPSNELGDINAGASEGMEAIGYSRELAMNSWFGRLKYNFAGKYLLEANLRADASSRFNKDNRWGVFPSFSGAWRVSEESFMQDLSDVISSMKVRGSWGKLGNQNIGDYYPALATYAIGEDYPFNDGLNTGIGITSSKKADISWEKTTTWGFGMDAELWHCLNLSVDYYNRETTDIIMDADAPKEYGMNGYKDNIGSMLNSGIELSAQYHGKLGAVEVNVGGNFAYNHNEILSLGEGVDMMGTGSTRWIVGSPIDSYYGYRTNGLFQTQEQVDAYVPYIMSGKKRLPGDIRFVDVDGDGEVTGDDRVILKSQQPKYTFGLNLGAKYKMFDFTAFFQGVAGCVRYMYNEAYGNFSGDSGSPSTFWTDRWTPENHTNDVPRATLNGELSMPSTLISDFWAKDASYLRLKNIQVGFTFPKSWCQVLKIPSARVYYSGQNLFTIKGMPKGMDPESPSGRGGSYPQVKVNSFGVNVSF